LGELALLQQNYAEAKRLFQKSLLIFQEVNDKGGLATSLFGLGNTALAQDEYQAAWQNLQQALQLAAEIHYARLIGSILTAVGELWLKAGRRERGAALLAFIQDEPAVVLRLQNQAKQLLAGAGPHPQPEHPDGRSLNEVVAEVLASEALSVPESVLAANRASRRFIKENLIATGGMGQVYLGRDTTTGRPVAIKRLKPELVAHHPEAVQRLIREGEILRQLNHPNIVKVLALIEAEDQPMIVMEYVPGGSLKDLLEQQLQLPCDRTLQIGLELADALARVHHLGILHRDLKPANVLLAADGTPRLTDFGVAYLAQKDSKLTQEGAILGTTAYLSPEAWRGETLDARSDVWSFGAVLYEMLAGQPPFAAENAVAIMTAILTQPLPDLGDLRPDAPAALTELVRQMLVKERDLRLDSMRQVAAGLEVIRRSLAM
jgi:predicted Ser/Thr protein kinase